MTTAPQAVKQPAAQHGPGHAGIEVGFGSQFAGDPLHVNVLQHFERAAAVGHEVSAIRCTHYSSNDPGAAVLEPRPPRSA